MSCLEALVLRINSSLKTLQLPTRLASTEIGRQCHLSLVSLGTQSGLATNIRTSLVNGNKSFNNPGLWRYWRSWHSFAGSISISLLSVNVELDFSHLLRARCHALYTYPA